MKVVASKQRVSELLRQVLEFFASTGERNFVAELERGLDLEFCRPSPRLSVANVAGIRRDFIRYLDPYSL